jgi:heme-degrading monooxygenase HmoA
MITEHALLPVKPGEEAAFEAAFDEAKAIIAAAAGFIDVTLSRCIERPSTYLLIVHWMTLADHTEGFRGSEAFQQWRALLHHFYEPFPQVEHFQTVATA